MKDLEKFLIENNWWIVTDAGRVVPTAKWSKMIDVFLNKNPSKPITEKQIWNYVRTF